MAKKRRRRKKGSSGGGSAPVMNLSPGEVPTDEQLELEAAELEKELPDGWQVQEGSLRASRWRLTGSSRRVWVLKLRNMSEST